MTASREELLEYYKRELTYLRRMGTAFGETYPKVAGRLEMGMDECPDPHIERLIESFAFLSARIQCNIESEVSQLSSALLGVLYPQFVSPIPSMTVAKFVVDPTQGGLTTGHTIPEHTPLFAKTEQGETTRFRTCYPTTLWPIKVSYAGFESTEKFEFLDDAPDVSLVLRLRLESMSDSLKEMSLDKIRFYLNGERMMVNSLYELLFGNVTSVAILPENKKRPIMVGRDVIKPVGFKLDEGVLPYPPNAHLGYRLLHEYFTFPEKYLFFDLDNLEVHSSERKFDVLILLNQVPKGRLAIDRTTFAMGCSPVINLFSKTTDPIRLDERKSEYLLVPDKRREKSTELHSINTISASSDSREETTRIAPYFSYNHEMEKKGQNAFWHIRREDTGRKDLPGSHVYISFVDLDFQASLPPRKTVFGHTLCTNRSLAEQLPAGALMQIETAAPVSYISILRKPTTQINPPLEGAALWRLISHLSLNYLSLSEGKNSLKALREILRLYSFSDHTDSLQQISGIRDMECSRVVRRVGLDAWRGFCRGIEISLTFDERQYVGSSAFLLAAVLNSFFPLYSSVNSFTQLVIKSTQRERIWKRWQPMAGEQIIL